MSTRAFLVAAALLVEIAAATHAAGSPLVLEPAVADAPAAAYGTTRMAIAVAAPTTFRARLDAVPPHSRLMTAIAVPAPTPGTPASAIRFRIALEAPSGETTLYERVLDGNVGADQRWVDVGLALDALAGRSATLRFDAVSATGASVAGWWAPPEIFACDPDAPSLLLVTIDALRADHVGSYGYARPTTPYLDAFATDATRFAAAFAGGPKTIPSIPQILTGHYFYWQRATPGLRDLLPDGVPSRAIVNNPWIGGFLRGERPSFDAVQADEALDARAITSAGLRFLTAAGRCPTVLFLHYLDVHTPYHAPKRYARRFVDRHAATTIGLTWDDVTSAWQNRYDDADRQRIVDLYDGSLAYTDRQIGRLLRGLARRGRLASTLVVVTADHGEELWDHRHFFHGQSLYDELLHVPLLVRFPRDGHGRVVDGVVRTVDLMPTVAEAFGRTGAPSDGQSLRALAVGDGSPGERTAFALVSHAAPRTPERHAVRTRTHKLVHDVTDGAIQIYDLVSDPHEKRNLGPAAPAAADLLAALASFRAQIDHTGYQLRLRGVADRAVRYVVDVTTAPPLPVIAIDRPTLETDDLVDFDPHTSAFTVSGTLTPGDEDRVRFDVLAATGELKIAIRVDGAPAPDGTLRIGVDGVATTGVVDLADPRLLGAPAATDEPATSVVANLWRAGATAGRDAAPLDDATRQRLRQLGYVE